MNSVSLRTMLRPAFMALARPGIWGPHKHIADLLLSGSKPAGYVYDIDDAEEQADFVKLEAAVAAGQLIKAEKPCRTYTNLWVAADEFAATWPVIVRAMQDKNTDEEALEILSDALATPGSHDSKVHNAFARVAPDIQSALDVHQLNEIEDLAQGRRPFIVTPEWQGYANVLPRSHRRLMDLARDGRIVQKMVPVPSGEATHYYAQPGSEHVLAELTAEKITDARRGELLGYSDSDIAFYRQRMQDFEGMGRLEYAARVVTNPLRRWARETVMKIDGPSWQRNP